MSRHLYYSLNFNKFLCFAMGFSTLIASAARHPAHPSDDTPYKVIGGFQLNPDVVRANNGGLSVNRYGTTTLLQQAKEDEVAKPLIDPLTQKEIVIRDQHYQLIDFKSQPLSKWVDGPRKSLGLGIRLLPATTGYKSETVVQVGGVQIKGSNLVDDYLRKVVYGYQAPTGRRKTPEQIKADQPIFAQIAYVHPEGFQGEPFSLSNSVNLKTEMGFTHKGLYIGEGKTVNSPPGYHFDSWWDSEEQANYPAFLSVLDFSGFSDGTNFNVKEFNKNGILSALVLNETNPEAIEGIFPSEFDYKFDPLYANTLEKVLDFYARWLIADPNDPIFDSESPESKFFKTYCAEHATDITNILLNLPQNLTGYTEVFGEVDGPKLFELAMDKVYTSGGLRSAEQAEYIRDAYLGKAQEARRRKIGEGLVPFWKVLEKDLPANQQTKQVVSRDPATGKFVATNKKFKEVGYALGWQPETVADLLKDFVQAYLPWPRVGSLTSVAAILGFSGEAKKRMAIPVMEYIQTITPVVQQVFLHEAAMEIGFQKLSGQTSESAIYQKFAGARTAREEALNGLMGTLVAKMQSAERGEARIDAKTASQIKQIARSFMAQISSDSSDPAQDAGWRKASELANQSLQGQTFSGANALVKYRESIYDNQFTATVKPMLAELNKIDPNPTPNLTVKYYYAPAVHVRVAMGIHDADSPTRKHVRLYPVGHVIQANETLPLRGHNSATIDDSKSIDLKVL